MLKIHMYVCICALTLVVRTRGDCSAKKSKPGAKGKSKANRTVSALTEDTVSHYPCAKSRPGLMKMTMVSHHSPAAQVGLQ